MSMETLLNLMISNPGSLVEADIQQPPTVQGNMFVQPPPQVHQRTRNDSGGSAASSLSSGSYSPPVGTSNLHMLTMQDFTLPQELTRHHVPNRKMLDRSMSEPVGHILARQQSVNDQHLARQQSINDQHQQQQQKVNPNRYKTEMCRPFEENGYCKYGNKCQFAHGSQEMRSVSRHPKYKTDLCRTYHTIGFCPYGPRCHFIHAEDERKLSHISHMKREHAAQQAVAVQQQVIQQQRIPSPPTSSGTQQLRLMNQAAPQVPLQVSADWQTQLQQQRALGRPRNLDWSVPLSMGSTASSITDSPIPSPTSSVEEDHFVSLPRSARVAPPPGFTSPPVTAPATMSAAFTFPQNLQVATPALASTTPGIPSPVESTSNLLRDLAEGLQSTPMPTTCDQDVLEATQLLKDIFLTTPFEPTLDSIHQSCDDTLLDLNNPAFRLPIFSQLSQDA